MKGECVTERGSFVTSGTDFPDDVPSRDLERILRVLRSRAPLIAVATISLAAIAFGIAVLQERQYTATASLLFRDPKLAQTVFGSDGAPTLSGSDAERQGQTNLQLINLESVASRTARALGDADGGKLLAEKINIVPEGKSDVVQIQATDEDPTVAQKIANQFTHEFIAFRAETDTRRLLEARHLAEREFDHLTPDEQRGPRGAQLSRAIERLGILASLQTGNAERVQRADLPTEPSAPRPVRSALFGGALGFLVGILAAFLLERFNNRIRNQGEAEEAFSLPILTAIPRSKAIEETNRGKASSLPFAEIEAFRMLRASLRYFNVDAGLRTVAVTSALPQEGKSTIAWNLAQLSASQDATILVEADLRNPTQSRNKGINYSPGLADVLTHQVALSDAIQKHTVDLGPQSPGQEPAFDVLVSGAPPPNPAELLESQAMTDLLSNLRERYKVVIIDTPPTTVVADAYPIFSEVDGVLLVCRLGQSTQESARALQSSMQQINAHVLGVVLNDSRARREYGYSYRYQP